MTAIQPNEKEDDVKKTLYIDMDNTLVDFKTRLEGVAPSVLAQYKDRVDEIPGFFAVMQPMPGAIKAFHELSRLFDTYILSTAPWHNPSAWQHKVEWVHLHFGKYKHLDHGEENPAYKRLILSHHKNLNRGQFLVDDRPHKNGADKFEGEVVGFGAGGFRDWPAGAEYLRARA